MSEQSKSARAAMRDKARRLTRAGDNGKVDASDYTPGKAMNADKKTGLRPVSPRTYKLGGKVQGDRGPRRADKTSRSGKKEGGGIGALDVLMPLVPLGKRAVDGGKGLKGGGRAERKDGGKVADAIVNRNVKEANAEKFGKPHIGGLKKGGRAEKCGGGPTARKDGGSVAGGERPTGDRIPRKDGGSTEKMVPISDRKRAIAADVKAATRPADPDQKTYRPERASGGRTKGKTNINIIVNPNKAENDKPPMPGPIPAPPPPPMPPPPPPPPGPPPGGPGAPPMPPPSMMAGAGGPPPMRARGGRLGANKIGGAGGGLGRLEKANMR